MVTVIILAGGVGSRVGAGRPKQFVEVLGKPVLAYTIEIFQNNPQIDAIEVVCHKKWKEYLTGNDRTIWSEQSKVDCRWRRYFSRFCNGR